MISDAFPASERWFGLLLRLYSRSRSVWIGDIN